MTKNRQRYHVDFVMLHCTKMEIIHLVNILTCVIFEIILVVCSHPDENISINRIISNHNYPVEEHVIETADGYLLKTFRIPHGQKEEESPQRKVVFLAHGLASSADDWITVGEDALPYYLADNGFDVWLFNARGNRHSRKHTKFDPDRDIKEFWNFSWHEIGIYDLPANINYILNYTNSKNLFYVGHSQGCTSCLVMLSQLPDMGSKITVAALLAPAVYFVDVKPPWPLKIFSVMYPPKSQENIFYEFPPKTSSNIKTLCSIPGFSSVCYNTLYFNDPGNDHPIDQKLVPVIVQHALSTFSTKQVFHYSQIMQSGEFKQYDYETELNLKMYGTSKPPYYNISGITTPMALMYGDTDTLASPMSVKKVAKELTNSPILCEVPFIGFNHLDFLWANNAKKLVYEKVYEIFRK